MIKVSVMYPYTDGARFDHAWYRDRHMPVVKSRLGLRSAAPVLSVSARVTKLHWGSLMRTSRADTFASRKPSWRADANRDPNPHVEYAPGRQGEAPGPRSDDRQRPRGTDPRHRRIPRGCDSAARPCRARREQPEAGRLSISLTGAGRCDQAARPAHDHPEREPRGATRPVRTRHCPQTRLFICRRAEFARDATCRRTTGAA